MAIQLQHSLRLSHLLLYRSHFIGSRQEPGHQNSLKSGRNVEKAEKMPGCHFYFFTSVCMHEIPPANPATCRHLPRNPHRSPSPLHQSSEQSHPGLRIAESTLRDIGTTRGRPRKSCPTAGSPRRSINPVFLVGQEGTQGKGNGRENELRE